MREAPEIAPEVRGLLEELVADPRSSMRLVPKRPLRCWFDSDGTVRARDVSGTKLERHLIEAHREELAQLLFEAARIAFLKAPTLFVGPITQDGTPFDLARAEGTWRKHASSHLVAASASPSIELVRECLSGAPVSSMRLATASLLLVASDQARFALAQSMPWDHPRSAIRLFRRLSMTARPEYIRSHALNSVAARLCALDCLAAARAAYRAAARASTSSVPSLICSLNISCFLGDEPAAISDAGAADSVIQDQEASVLEEQTLHHITTWSRARQKKEVDLARHTARRAASSGSRSAQALLDALN